MGAGDIVVTQANSSELTKYGIPMGHKNYAAAYATGLLVARRTLKRFGSDETFKGKEELDGEDYHIKTKKLRHGRLNVSWTSALGAHVSVLVCGELSKGPSMVDCMYLTTPKISLVSRQLKR